MEFHHIDYSIAPKQMFRKICALENPVWLDSGKPASPQSRYDILTALPQQILAAENTNADDVERFISAAQSLLDSFKTSAQSTTCPFQGGLIGFWGYDLFTGNTSLEKPGDIDFPKACLGLYLWAIIYDHHRQSASMVIHPECDTNTRKTIRDLLAGTTLSGADNEFRLTSAFEASENKEKYFRAIGKIKDYIRAGDVYQVNYAQHFQATYLGDTSAAYLSQRNLHPAPFSAYIGFNGKAVLSHSPEEFLSVLGREVQTQPIKGTAPRAKDPKIDQRNADVLQASDKDRAENLMIVDLLRNDLGKACVPGSISVPKLFELQSFSNVHHLVSKVRGSLADNVSILQLMRHCHPGGSITGAPKKRAMEIIDELETRSRSLYCGSIGYISLCGHSHTSIAIRTMIADGAHIHCWGGGGIVADSDTEKEYQETLFKVGPMMHSLEKSYLDKTRQLSPSAK